MRNKTKIKVMKVELVKAIPTNLLYNESKEDYDVYVNEIFIGEVCSNYDLLKRFQGYSIDIFGRAGLRHLGIDPFEIDFQVGTLEKAKAAIEDAILAMKMSIVNIK